MDEVDEVLHIGEPKGESSMAVLCMLTIGGSRIHSWLLTMSGKGDIVDSR
jgi:hypothetical protein